MFIKVQKGSNKKRTIAINVFALCIATILYTGTASAGDDSRTAESPEQLASLNASMEQIFLNIPQNTQKIEPSLIDKVHKGGRVPVIVRLRDHDLPYGFFSDKQSPRSEVIDALQKTVLDDVIAQTSGDEAGLHVKRFHLIPAMGLLVDVFELEALLANPTVIDIVKDIPVPPALRESVPLIGAGPNGSFSGYSGQGQTVAILDTGVDKNHLFLSGKVVSEACYSNYFGLETSLCPGGAASSTAPNSALPCAFLCDHGTHVAGIVAGKRITLSDDSEISGVAKEASIIAIQVFTRFDSEDDCGAGKAPCVLSYDSDQILGLERVYALRNTYSIASVNISLGGGEYFAPCDTKPAKPVIDMLRAAGIATVIASGNESYTNALGAPACISSAISVGSTTKTDVVSSFSNSAYFLSLLAPGGFGDGTNKDILSSVPGEGGWFEYKPGTSMAAPHVAGAWAVLKQAKPDASVTDVLSALQLTGMPIVDWRTGTGNRVKSRIDVAAAVEALDVCNIEWDLDGDCDVDKEDANILKLRQKEEKTYLKVLFKAQKDEIKFFMGYYYEVCGTGYDFNGNCVIDKEDAKFLKIWQKGQKTYYKNLHKAEKAAMKVALKR